MSRKRLAVGLLALPSLVLLYLALRTVWIEVDAVHPPRAKVPAMPAWMAAAAGRSVALRTDDGVLLKGWLVPSRTGRWLALFHGYGGTRADLSAEAELLQREGYGLLMVDSRAHGESGGDRYTHGDRERADVRAVIDYLVHEQGAPPGSLGILAFSAGTAQSTLVAADDRRVGALVLLAPVSSIAAFSRDEYGRLGALRGPIANATMRMLGIDVDAVSPVSVVARIAPRAVLVVHGDKDAVIPLSRAKELFAAAREPRELLVVHGAGHGDYLSTAARDYGQALVRFLDRRLNGAANQGAPPDPPAR